MKPVLLLLVATSAILSGCASPDAADADGEASPQTLGGPGETVVVDMTDGLAFEPEEIVIHKGTTVVWKNVGAQHNHDVTHDHDDPAFQSYTQSYEAGNLEPGDDYRHTFTEAGTFPYFCKWHGKSSMAGTVTVVE